MSRESKAALEEILLGTGTVLLIVLFMISITSLITSFIMVILYSISYWLNPENWEYILSLMVICIISSAYWLYPKIKEEINKNKNTYQ